MARRSAEARSSSTGAWHSLPGLRPCHRTGTGASTRRYITPGWPRPAASDATWLPREPRPAAPRSATPSAAASGSRTLVPSSSATPLDRPGSTLIDRLDRAVGRSGVSGPGPHEPVVVELLDDVGRPAGDPGHGEDRGVDLDLQAHVVIQPGAGPVDVGRQVLLRGDRLLDRLGDPFPFVL